MDAADIIYQFAQQYPVADLIALSSIVMNRNGPGSALRKVLAQVAPVVKENLTSRNRASNRIRAAVEGKVYRAKVMFKGKEIVCLYKLYFDRKKSVRVIGSPLLPVNTDKGRLYYLFNSGGSGLEDLTVVTGHALDRVVQRADDVPNLLSERCFFGSFTGRSAI